MSSDVLDVLLLIKSGVTASMSIQRAPDDSDLPLKDNVARSRAFMRPVMAAARTADRCTAVELERLS